MLKASPAALFSWTLILSASSALYEVAAVVILLALSPSATVNVASSFTVPVSFLAVRSWLAITLIVRVAVDVAVPSDTI